MISSISLQQLRATLAALSATGLVACAGGNEPAQSPVDAKEVAPAAAPATTDAAPAEAKAAETSAAPADAAAAEAKPAAATEEAKPAPAPATEAAAPAAPSDSKPAATKANAKRKAAGAKGGCGAGTCG